MQIIKNIVRAILPPKDRITNLWLKGDTLYHFNEDKWRKIGNYDEIILELKQAIDNIDLTTEKVTTTTKIPVAGGPLAKLLNDAGITEITPSTNLQSLLLSLFTKEVYPTPVFKEGTVSSSLPAMSFSLGTSFVEVGQTVTAPAVNIGNLSVRTTNREYSGFTYGYSLSNNSNKQDNKTNISVAPVVTEDDSSAYSIRRTINTATTDTGTTSLGAKTFKAIEGTNTIKVEYTGKRHKAVFAAMPAYYTLSNLGNTNAQHVTQAKNELTLFSTAPAGSSTVTVTGLYPFYAKTVIIDYFTKLPLTTSKTLIGIKMPDETVNSKHAFKIPAKFTVTEIAVYNTITKEYEAQPLDKFTVTTEDIDVQGNPVSYKVYTRNQGTNGSSIFKIIFK